MTIVQMTLAGVVPKTADGKDAPPPAAPPADAKKDAPKDAAKK